MGGPVAELLTRTGIKRIHLWDMDKVASHNLGNQIYAFENINQEKTKALSELLNKINPNLEVKVHAEVTPKSRLQGYIFLCVDNIDLRRELCTAWKRNPNIKFVTDGRMRLTDGTIHSADWSDRQEQLNMIASMQYTHEEALDQTPVSACGLSLSIVCTPRILAAMMVTNLIKFFNTGTYNRFIQIDAYQPFLDSYTA